MTTTLLDRYVRWNLDLDGDFYGDERERYRWYEGIASAASMQWLAVPWAAAVMVWPLGRPSVLPLAVILVLMWIPIVITGLYVRRRRVDTVPRSWTPRWIFWTALSAAPYAVFLIGALYHFDPDGGTWQGATVGAVLGGMGAGVAQTVAARRKRRREALVPDED